MRPPDWAPTSTCISPYFFLLCSPYFPAGFQKWSHCPPPGDLLLTSCTLILPLFCHIFSFNPVCLLPPDSSCLLTRFLCWGFLLAALPRPLHLTRLLRGMMTDLCCSELLFWAHILPTAPSPLGLQVHSLWAIQSSGPALSGWADDLLWALMVHFPKGSRLQSAKYTQMDPWKAKQITLPPIVAQTTMS